jgi:hypothetical protein
MARKLETFPAVASTSKYAWDQLLDGQPWECIQGEDFLSRPTTFVANARTQAKRRGGTIRTRNTSEGDRISIALQFRPSAEAS